MRSPLSHLFLRVNRSSSSSYLCKRDAPHIKSHIIYWSILKPGKVLSESHLLKRILFWEAVLSFWKLITPLFLSCTLIFGVWGYTKVSYISACAYLERTAKIFQVTNTNKPTKIGSCNHEECLLKSYTCYIHSNSLFMVASKSCLEHNYHYSSYFFLCSKLQLIYVISICNIPIEPKFKFLSFFSQLNHFIAQDKNENCARFYANLV